jgi:hypothetical protein
MAHSTVSLLDAYARRMGLPIVGVRLGRKDDRSTWSIQFSDEATQSDRAKEAETIAAFDLEAEEAHAHGLVADARVADPAIAALITVMANRLGDDTSDDLRSRVRDHLLANEG